MKSLLGLKNLKIEGCLLGHAGAPGQGLDRIGKIKMSNVTLVKDEANSFWAMMQLQFQRLASRSHQNCERMVLSRVSTLLAICNSSATP